MSKEQFEVFSMQFSKSAHPLMRQIRQVLIDHGHGPFTEVQVKPDDTERTLWFWKYVPDDINFEHGIEFCLCDGNIRGFVGVGLNFNCSTGGNGVLSSLGNFVPETAIATPEDLAKRIELIVPSNIANLIVDEWDRMQRKQETLAER